MKNKVSASPSVQDCLGLIEPQLELVRTRLKQRLIVRDVGISQRLEAIGIGGGKLLRPSIILLTGRVCGGIRDEHIDLAVMVELVHTATLLHDDVIDKATMRRSQPTANVKWGNTAAVLLGDFLLSRAFLAGSEIKIQRASFVLGETAEQICQGELLQNIRQKDWSMTAEDYLEIIAAKTASLFAAGSYLAARASGASDAVAEAMRQYGHCVGIAFQITDDILDITGNAETEGKTLGSDLAMEKPTLPLIYALADKTPKQRQELIKKLSREQWIKVMKENDALGCARQTANDFVGQAVKALKVCNHTKGRDAMEKIALAIAART